MSEKKFLDAGAETVCGDLILQQKIVGRYRNGQFVLTEAGVELAARMDDAALGGVEEVVAAPKKKKARAADVEMVEPVAGTPPEGEPA